MDKVIKYNLYLLLEQKMLYRVENCPNFCKMVNHEDKYYQSVLLEYTGLKDKNKTEIYKSDILLAPNGEKLVVGWNIFTAGFVVRGNKTNCPIMMIHTDMYEKIGNFYQNPELIELED